MLIGVINESTLTSNADCQTMVAAIQKQLNLHVLPAWGQTAATIKFYPNKAKMPGHAWVVNMLDSSTQAGALGYHSDDNDVIDAFIFAQPVLSNGGTMMVFNPKNPSQYTVSGTLSHEVCEMIGDRFANGFSMGPQISQGNLYAQELCDPVEGDNYAVAVGSTQVAVSNFIFPSWLNPSATLKLNAPFDYLRKLTKPFTMDAGGYMIVANMGNEGQVSARHCFGEKLPDWRKEQIQSKFYRRSIAK